MKKNYLERIGTTNPEILNPESLDSKTENREMAVYKMSYLEKLQLERLGNSLHHVMGINFLSVIEDYAINEKITECEVSQFLKKNYPGADKNVKLCQDDKHHLFLLMKYYFQKVEEHDKIESSNETKVACCQPTPNLDDYSEVVYGNKFLSDPYSG